MEKKGQQSDLSSNLAKRPNGRFFLTYGGQPDHIIRKNGIGFVEQEVFVLTTPNQRRDLELLRRIKMGQDGPPKKNWSPNIYQWSNILSNASMAGL